MNRILEVTTSRAANVFDILYSVSYYDKRARLIQSKSTNHLGGKEKELVAYSFDGLPDKRFHEHTVAGSAKTEEYLYTYDAARRPKTTSHKWNGGTAVVLRNRTYDALGRPLTERTGNVLTTSYAYDIRGRETKRNNTQYTGEMGYTSGSNVKWLSWQTGGTTRKYEFTYDGLSRLTSSETTDYAGNHIYVNNILKRTLTENGYIENNVYFYTITDRLGSGRMVVNQSGIAVQSTNYYPFGAQQADATGTQVQPYKYTGKEYDQTHGLNLYDYGARFYDPGLGRFLTMDPLAEKFYSVSPYAYCLNNPIRFLDPKGKDIRDFIGGIIQAIGSNLALGTASTNTSFVTNESHYNVGRNVGDVISVMMGVDEIIMGGGIATSEGVAAVGTAGISSLVTIPIYTMGVGMAVHGSGVMETAIKSLATQNGRISETNPSNGSRKR